jgi:hypothetical protein
MKFFKILLGVSLVIGIFSSSLHAGILMVSAHQSAVNSQDALTSKAYVDKDRMRVEMKGQTMDQIFIFRQDKELFWVIDNRAKTYMEMTKQDLQKMKEKVDEAMTMMQEQMKNMPPEQRKMIEQMMKGKMQASVPATAPTVTKRSLRARKLISGFVINTKAPSKEKRKEDIWTTDWRQLGLTAEDFNVMQAMNEYFDEFSKGKNSLYKIGSKEWEQKQGYAGLPVKTIRYTEGKVQHTTEIKEIQRQDFVSTLFDLPAGLTKKAMPMGDRGRQ